MVVWGEGFSENANNLELLFQRVNLENDCDTSGTLAMKLWVEILVSSGSFGFFLVLSGAFRCLQVTLFAIRCLQVPLPLGLFRFLSSFFLVSWDSIRFLHVPPGLFQVTYFFRFWTADLSRSNNAGKMFCLFQQEPRTTDDRGNCRRWLDIHLQDNRMGLEFLWSS